MQKKFHKIFGLKGIQIGEPVGIFILPLKTGSSEPNLSRYSGACPAIRESEIIGSAVRVIFSRKDAKAPRKPRLVSRYAGLKPKAPLSLKFETVFRTIVRRKSGFVFPTALDCALILSLRRTSWRLGVFARCRVCLCVLALKPLSGVPRGLSSRPDCFTQGPP